MSILILWIKALGLTLPRELSLAIKEDTSSARDTLPSLQMNIKTVIDEQSKQGHHTIMKWLSPTDFSAQQDDIITRREEGTGQWFLGSPKFKRWLQGSDKTLFCPGMPGAGKTMIAAIAIDELINQVRNETIGVAFVYCSYTTPVDEHANAVLSALLRQLVQQRPSIPEHVLCLYDEKLGHQSKLSPKERFSSLQSVLKEYSKVYVVVDALDECIDEKGIRPQLLERLHCLQSEVDLRLMITSRPTSEVEEEFGQIPKLEIRANDEDVNRFTAEQMHKLPNCIKRSEDLRRSVPGIIAEAADGMLVYHILILEHHRLMTLGFSLLVSILIRLRTPSSRGRPRLY